MSYPDPLDNLDKYKCCWPKEPIRLPITSIVFENRPEMMDRIRRITEWHRRWFTFEREILISNCNPNIPGLTCFGCSTPPQNMLRLWYSDMCVHGFDSLCMTPYLLVWQWDGFIVNPELWSNEFLEWDYIGAPHGLYWRQVANWLKSMWPNWPNPFDVSGHGDIAGNGGFSLRSKKFLQATNGLSRSGITPADEDLYLCVERRHELESQGIKFCPAEIAKKFSIDSEDVVRSFGFHNPDHLGVVKKYLEDKYL